MKVLALNDGQSFEFIDESTIYDLKMECEAYAEIDPIREALSVENLDGATFDGEEIENIIPLYVKVNSNTMQGSIEVDFLNRDKTDVEILQETQAEQDEAINFLLMQ